MTKIKIGGVDILVASSDLDYVQIHDVTLSRGDGEGSQDARSSHFEILRSAQDDVGFILVAEAVSA